MSTVRRTDVTLSEGWSGPWPEEVGEDGGVQGSVRKEEIDTVSLLSRKTVQL